MMNPLLQPKRTVAELKELRALTGDEHGAQRVAFTETWAKARAWMREKLAELPVEVKVDAAGNQWATLRGESEKELLIGGHIDSCLLYTSLPFLLKVCHCAQQTHKGRGRPDATRPSYRHKKGPWAVAIAPTALFALVQISV